MDPTGEPSSDAAVLGSGHHHTASEEPPQHPRPWWAPVTVAAFLGLVVCTNVANGVWARWVNTNPEGLLLLSSRQRYLVLTAAGGIGVVPYAAIGFARIAAAFVVCHLAGRAFREDLLRVFLRYLGLTPEAIDTFDRWLNKAEIVVIPFFVGSNIVAALTGIHRTPPVRLAVLLSIGIAGRLALMWWLAEVFEDPLLDVLDFLQRWQIPIVIASFALVILVNVRNFRRGAGP